MTRIITCIILMVILLLGLTVAGYANPDNDGKQDVRSIAVEKYFVEGSPFIFEHIMFSAVINGKSLMLEMTINRPENDRQYPVLKNSEIPTILVGISLFFNGRGDRT